MTALITYENDRPCACKRVGECLWCHVEEILVSEYGSEGVRRVGLILRDWADQRSVVPIPKNNEVANGNG